MTDLTPALVGIELLPCPFCAAKAILSTVARDWYSITAEHVESCILEDQQHYCPQTDEQLALLVRDWNMRAPVIKDHEFRESVNELTSLAQTYGQTQQLRGRLSAWLSAFASKSYLVISKDSHHPQRTIDPARRGCEEQA